MDQNRPKTRQKMHFVSVQIDFTIVQIDLHNAIFKNLREIHLVQSIARCYRQQNIILKGQILVQTFHQIPYDHGST